MKTFLTILFAALCAATGHGQTLKALMYNTTNGRVVYSGSNTLTFTNNNVELGGLLLGGTTNTLGTYDLYAPAAKFEEIQIAGYNLSVNENGNLTLFTSLFFNNTSNAAITRTNLSLGLPALTNTSNVTTMRALAGSTNTNEPYSGSVSLTNTNSLVFSNGVLLRIQ